VKASTKASVDSVKRPPHNLSFSLFEGLFEDLLLLDMLVQFPVSMVCIQYDKRWEFNDEINK
jgi:hypothetical protein